MGIKDLVLADRLTVENTLMANERTLLSFFRTSIFFFATGISILNLHFLSEVNYLGWFFVILSPIILVFGFYRYWATKKHIETIIDECSQKKK